MTIPQILRGAKKDLGGFSVARILPQAARRSLGPFVFFDEMGPATFEAGQGIDVRPHPHIGLATITWLFEGGLTHRDSLGTEIDIVPGAVNWMTAGCGITHSERSPPALRAAGHRMHGFQAWVALPRAHEEIPPSFQHVAADDLPVISLPGVRLTLIAGQMDDHESPVVYPHPILYAEAWMDTDARLDLPQSWGERGVYVLSGEASMNGHPLETSALSISDHGPATLSATARTHLMLLGGAPMPEPRHLEWNFVHHDKTRIAQAVDDWRAGRFPEVPGETERIPY